MKQDKEITGRGTQYKQEICISQKKVGSLLRLLNCIQGFYSILLYQVYKTVFISPFFLET